MCSAPRDLVSWSRPESSIRRPLRGETVRGFRDVDSAIRQGREGSAHGHDADSAGTDRAGPDRGPGRRPSDGQRKRTGRLRRPRVSTAGREVRSMAPLQAAVGLSTGWRGDQRRVGLRRCRGSPRDGASPLVRRSARGPGPSVGRQHQPSSTAPHRTSPCQTALRACRWRVHWPHWTHRYTRGGGPGPLAAVSPRWLTASSVCYPPPHETSPPTASGAYSVATTAGWALTDLTDLGFSPAAAGSTRRRRPVRIDQPVSRPDTASVAAVPQHQPPPAVTPSPAA